MRAPAPAYTTGSVTSRDGTVLGYRRLGTGPAVVLVHGSMMSSANFMRLGAALSADFTVYLPDRRGRGLSGPHGPGFTLERAAEDVGALVEHAGARDVFGLSAGAVPVLCWALTRPEGYRVALYEPPLPVEGSSPTAWLERYEREMARGRLAAALVTVARGTQDSPLMEVLPRWLLVPLMELALRAQERQGGDQAPLRNLVPTVGADARMVREATGLVGDAAAVRADLLLLGGSRSARYLKNALDALESAVPRARRVELRGLGHLAADNGGRPDRVARALVDFFGTRPVPRP
ncbi:alpha/beta hydrolase [Nocardiopsis dassonvillei]|uniref:alpha/beta fold hydrolase n=1 Tax=Nocardiopsis dassonvillei TaxID=2014 RepID=UPI0020109760|nr:alpha/beta hydrolase [Nocardiopsis dassonvillei]MCK9868616.1 alpha/beta hydrolase [Nocardiopsis dassonvillei]